MRRNSDEDIRRLERLVAQGEDENAESELAVLQERRDGLAGELERAVARRIATHVTMQSDRHPELTGIIRPAHVRRLVSAIILDERLGSFWWFGVPNVHMFNEDEGAAWAVGLVDPLVESDSLVWLPYVSALLVDQTVLLGFVVGTSHVDAAPYPNSNWSPMWSRRMPYAHGPALAPVIEDVERVAAPVWLVRRWILLGRLSYFGPEDARILRLDEGLRTNPALRRDWANLRDKYGLLPNRYLGLRNGAWRALQNRYGLFSRPQALGFETFFDGIEAMNRDHFNSLNTLYEVASEEDERLGRRVPQPEDLGRMLVELSIGTQLPPEIQARVGVEIEVPEFKP